MPKIRRLFKIVLGLSLLGWAAKVYAQQNNIFLNPPRNEVFAQFAEAIPLIDWQTPLESTDFQAYLRFYGLNFENTQHYAGNFVLPSQQKVFVHVLKPPVVSRGTLFALHGYFVHSALLKYVIERGLKEGYQVVVADLPGHGLSEGERVSIAHFSEYAALIETLTPYITTHLPGPYFLLGHSTGGSAVWEYTLKNPYNPYQKVVLGAPLVRSYLWELSAAGFYLGQGILPEVPRLLRPTTREPEFLAMVLKDPLQYPGTPVQWVRALIQWNDQVIEHYPPSAKPLLILQGTEDTVVEAAFNIPFLQRKFPLAEVEWFENCRHDLFWETQPLRERILDSTFTFLAENQ